MLRRSWLFAVAVVRLTRHRPGSAATHSVVRAEGCAKVPHPEGLAVQVICGAAPGSAVRACSSIRSPTTAELRGTRIDSIVAAPAAAGVTSSRRGAPRAVVSGIDTTDTKPPSGANASTATACFPGVSASAPSRSEEEAAGRNRTDVPPSAESKTRAMAGPLGEMREVTSTRLPG